MIDITQATLQEYAFSKGIQEKVASMSQAEKAMLRYRYVTEQLSFVMDDYQKTSDTWANRTRLLGQQFQQLGSTIGTALIGAFKPLIAALNSIMQKVISFVKTIVDALGAIFGWQLEITGSGGDGGAYDALADTMGDVADSAGDTSKGLGGAGKKAKELQKTLSLLPFDQLNQLAKENDSSGGGGGGGGGGAGSGAGTGGVEYSISRKDSISEQMTSDIKSLYDLGAYIGDALTSAMNGIDWDSIYEGARNFGTGLADFLNGLISPELFGALGRTIANSLNTVLYAELGFGTTFDWSDTGTSISEGINSFFRNFDFASLGESINVFVGGVEDMLISGLTHLDADAVGNGIATFLEKIDVIELASKLQRILILVFDEALSIIGAGFDVAPIETGLLLAFAGIKLTGAGELIANSLFGSVATTIEKLFGGIGKIIEGPFKKITGLSFAGLGESLEGLSAILGPVTIAVGAFAAAFLYLWETSESFRETISNLASVVKSSVTSAFEILSESVGNLKDQISKLLGNGAFSGLLEVIVSLISVVGAGGLASAFDVIAGALSAIIDVIAGVIQAFSGLFEIIHGAFTNNQDEFFQGFKDIGDGILTGIIQGFMDGMTGIGRAIGDLFDTVFNGICDIFGIHSPAETMKPLGGHIIGGIIEGITSAIPDVIGAILGLPSLIISGIGDAKTWLFSKGKDVVEGLKSGYDSVKESRLGKTVGKLKDDVFAKAGDIKSKIKSKGSDIIEGLKSGYDSVKQSKLFSTLTNLKSDAYTKIGDIKSKVKQKGSDIIEGLKTGYDGVKESKLFSEVAKVRNTVASRLGDMSGAVKSKGADIINGLKTGFNNNISSLTSAVSSLGSKVKNALPSFYDIGYNAIKSFKNGFTSIKIPTPHFNIGTETKSVLGISIKVPKFNGISWYAKGGILLNPQIFGYGNGSLLGGGEAGKEAMLPLENKRSMSMIADAITQNMSIADSDVIASAVERGVVTAMMNNSQNQVDTVVYAELKTEDNEVLARAVAKGQKSLQYRAGYSY